MSHFTVGVIVKNKGDLQNVLAPYSEQNPDYYERVPYMDKAQWLANYRQYHENTTLTDAEIWEEAKNEYGIDNVDEDMIYTCYNPDAKWDWYDIGGRWLNELKVPKHAESYTGSHYGEVSNKKQRGKSRWVDGARIKDILWEDMNKQTKEEIQHEAEFWDDYVEGKNPDKKYEEAFYKPAYYKQMYANKEDYIMKSGLFYTHDLLFCPEDGDQEWLSVGDMGWFGCDNATTDTTDDYLKRFYEIIHNPQYQDYWFIVVDCHI